MTLDQQVELEKLMQMWAHSIRSESDLLSQQIGCVHESKNYIGFSEQYEYCVKCDAKKEDGVWKSIEDKSNRTLN